jgi:hypothetical protein
VSVVTFVALRQFIPGLADLCNSFHSIGEIHVILQARSAFRSSVGTPQLARLSVASTALVVAKLTVFFRVTSVALLSPKTAEFGQSTSIVSDSENFSGQPNSPSKSKAENYDGLLSSTLRILSGEAEGFGESIPKFDGNFHAVWALPGH